MNITDHTTVMQQIDTRLSTIAEIQPDEARALRCLRVAMEGLLKKATYNPHRCGVPDFSDGYNMSSASTVDDVCETLTALGDQWRQGRND